MNEYQRKIEAHKIELEIKRNGSMYTVYRRKLDNYGEPIGVEKIREIRGLFHQMGLFYITVDVQAVAEAATTHSKGRPMLLCLYEETKDLTSDDFVIINGNVYNFVALSNVLEINVAVNISLEVEISGKGL